MTTSTPSGATTVSAWPAVITMMGIRASRTKPALTRAPSTSGATPFTYSSLGLRPRRSYTATTRRNIGLGGPGASIGNGVVAHGMVGAGGEAGDEAADALPLIPRSVAEVGMYSFSEQL